MKADEIARAQEPAKFCISSSYQGFADRQKDLFDQLNIVERNTRNLLATDDDGFMEVQGDKSPPGIIDEADSPPPRSELKMRQFRGKESIFKKPQARPPRSMPNRRVPDYQRNPHRWTRYSLDDVPTEDMSERANKAAAMSFLKDLEARKQEKMDESELSQQKITFKKISRKVEKDVGGQAADATAVVFRNSKVIMPEYIVGQKVAKEKRRERKAESSGGSGKEIKLDHLQEDEGDD